jgi:DNA-binding HxlR family transcriptional regulator
MRMGVTAHTHPTEQQPRTEAEPAASSARGGAVQGEPTCSQCCPRYHEAVELVGKRWTGAILYVLLHGGRRRFTEIANAVPDLSDRLLSERMKELEARKIVVRHVSDGTPTKVSYELTEKGRELAPAMAELKSWADRWLD